MLVWLITVGEPLPIDSGSQRLHRAGFLANLLTEQGDDVVWWTSTFDHVRKAHRYETDTVINMSDRLKLILLHSVGYKRNISLSRIIDHYGVARKFNTMNPSYRKPDVILCSLPTLELSLAATEYGKRHGVPVILDVRDLWPDIFVAVAPSWGRWLARIALTPFYKTVRRACSQATAIIGITSPVVDWGLRYANRERTSRDRDFPLGYSSDVPAKADIEAAQQRWAERGVKQDDFNICFFGTIRRQFEFDVIIAAAQKLKKQQRPFRFILCGNGELLDHFRARASGCRSVLFPGWVNSADIWTLMRMSRVGLAPYISTPDFVMSIPNKPVEYLSAGLPIVSSLQGVLKELLAAHQCGVTYAEGDSEELASVLMRLYDDPDRLQSMSQRASALFQERFVAEKVYGDMISYLESMARTRT